MPNTSSLSPNVMKSPDGRNMYETNFGGVILALRNGYKCSRGGWNGKGMWIALQTPDSNSKMKRPYIYISIVSGELVPWVASNGDLLANDWVIVE